MVWRSVEELQEAAPDETPTVTLLTREQLGVQALQEESQASKEDVAKDLCTVREDLELLKAVAVWQREPNHFLAASLTGASSTPQPVQNRRGVAEGGTTCIVR